jgi:hypothetical protein
MILGITNFGFHVDPILTGLIDGFSGLDYFHDVVWADPTGITNLSTVAGGYWKCRNSSAPRCIQEYREAFEDWTKVDVLWPLALLDYFLGSLTRPDTHERRRWYVYLDSPEKIYGVAQNFQGWSPLPTGCFSSYMTTQVCTKV